MEAIIPQLITLITEVGNLATSYEVHLFQSHWRGQELVDWNYVLVVHVVRRDRYWRRFGATYLFTNCLESDTLWVACQKEDSGCANSVTLDFNLSVREEDER